MIASRVGLDLSCAAERWAAFQGTTPDSRTEEVRLLLARPGSPLLASVLARLLLSKSQIETTLQSANLLIRYAHANMSLLVSACFARLLEILVWQLGDDASKQSPTQVQRIPPFLHFNSFTSFTTFLNLSLCDSPSLVLSMSFVA
jgi:hypothetical protein